MNPSNANEIKKELDELMKKLVEIQKVKKDQQAKGTSTPQETSKAKIQEIAESPVVNPKEQVKSEESEEEKTQ